MTDTEKGRDGSRPFLGWADELAEFEVAFRHLDPLESRRPDPALERMLSERMLEHAHDFRRVSDSVRELLESGIVHHADNPSSLFAWAADDARRESDQVHAYRLAVEGMVARYAAEHPDEIRG